MKTTLEYKGQLVTLEPLPMVHIPAGETLTICAWCDPVKTLAQSLTKAGYKLSHGVCEKHKQEFIDQMNHVTK